MDGVVGLGVVLGLDVTEAVRASLALVRTFGNFFKQKTSSTLHTVSCL